jgi:serine/threonine protein kinase
LTKNNTKMDELGDALSRFRTKYQIVSSLANDAESSSRVFQAKHLETGEEFAVKIIEKGQLKDPEKARREIEIMSKCNHQHIVRLFEAFQDNERAIIVMELMRGGTLFDRLSALVILVRHVCHHTLVTMCTLLTLFQATKTNRR